MDLEQAKTFLDGCERSELRDHVFGDIEVTWLLKGENVATGYFGGTDANVWVQDGKATHFFDGEDAKKLESCGHLDEVWRNDETGPDIYTKGAVMPGLTKEGVLEELTRD